MTMEKILQKERNGGKEGVKMEKMMISIHSLRWTKARKQVLTIAIHFYRLEA